MAYEGQIAGVGDRIPGSPLRSAAIRVDAVALRGATSAARLPRIVAAVREVAERGGELEFVNGGGTGSLARTAAAGIVTELTAGSGFYAPALFDNYRSLDARAGRVLLPPGGPAPGRRGRDPARRRLPGLGRRRAPTGCPSPTCPAGCASTARRAPARCRPRSPAPPPTSCGSATASTCATRRRASSASASTRSTWSRASAIVDEVPDLPRRGQGVPLTWRGSTSTRRSPHRSTTCSSCSAITPATRGFAASRPRSCCARAPRSETASAPCGCSSPGRCASTEEITAFERPTRMDYLIRKVNLPLEHDGGTIDALPGRRPGPGCSGARPSPSPVPVVGGAMGAVLAAGHPARLHPPARRHRPPRVSHPPDIRSALDAKRCPPEAVLDQLPPGADAIVGLGNGEPVTVIDAIEDGAETPARRAPAPDAAAARPPLHRRRDPEPPPRLLVPLAPRPRRLSRRPLRPRPEQLQRGAGADAGDDEALGRARRRRAAGPPRLLLARPARRVRRAADRRGAVLPRGQPAAAAHLRREPGPREPGRRLVRGRLPAGRGAAARGDRDRPPDRRAGGRADPRRGHDPGRDRLGPRPGPAPALRPSRARRPHGADERRLRRPDRGAARSPAPARRPTATR